MNDIEISRSIKMDNIVDVAKKYEICQDDIELYGKYKGKLSYQFLKSIRKNNDGKLILVTAVNPTPAGEGKTTVSIGLAQALEKIGHRTVLALREPSLGPCFGQKGGAAGGGYAQLIPMDELNLHFTGDFHAITYANNLLASMIDNHIHQGNELDIDTRSIVWKRCIDLNDRVLRNIVVGLGKKADGFTREDHFDITVASEIMAILCLSKDLNDLRRRLENIIVAYDTANKPVYAKQLNAVGAMMALLKDAFKPNIIQTIEKTLAIVHGGPFANIAHGCNSIIATKTALKLGEYAITEAGFGADLGAEKFLDIKCRVGNIKPDFIVIVATIKSIKYNAGIKLDSLTTENEDAVKEGIINLRKHIENMRKFGYEPIVAINRFPSDSDNELELVKKLIDTKTFILEVHSNGGNGAVNLAEYIVGNETKIENINYVYDINDSIEEKIEKIVLNIYGGAEVTFSNKALLSIRKISKEGYSNFPVCVAKTPYSFSNDNKRLGAPKDFTFNVEDVYLNSGAGMIVVIAGDIMRMPGLPKTPQAYNIDLNDEGEIIGLS